MQYIHILWDFNGTILDDVETGICCINRLLSRRNLPLLPDRAAYQAVFGFPIIEYYLRVGLDLEKEKYADLAIEWVKEYNREVKNAPLCPGVWEANRFFQGKGCHQTVLSATEKEMLRGQLTDLGLLEHFDDFTGLDNIHAAGKIELAKAYLQGKDPGKCLFLGDTCHDFEVARAVGADCILIAFGHQSRKQLESCGCPVIDSLLELPSLLKE